MSLSATLTPLYELGLRSSESLISQTKSIQLNQGESAQIRCTLMDSGFDPASLFMSVNHRNVTGGRGHSILYDLHDYNSSKGEMVFDCAARRRNQKFQLRSMKVVPKVQNPCRFGSCSSSLCSKGAHCLRDWKEGADYCLCSTDTCGCGTSWLGTTVWIVLLALMSSLATFFGVTYCRERRNQRESNSSIDEKGSSEMLELELQPRSKRETDELEALYDKADNIPNRRITTAPNLYDNVRYADIIRSTAT